MWKWLEETPVAQRPQGLSLFPAAAGYFRKWRSLRWFLLLLLPIALSAGAAGWLRGFGPAVVIGLVGSACAVMAFVHLASGATSSNWGTYFRAREPVRYWIGVGIVLVAYVFLSVAGWFIR